MITTIQSGSLPAALEDLSLINNPTTTIENTAFEGSATTLNALMLSSFRFTKIPDAFGHLTILQMLTMYDGNILDYNVEVMKKLGSTIVTLFLENVGLTSWPDWIQYYTVLSELTIVGSTITFIPNGALDLVSDKLKNLYLYSNRLAIIPEAISKLSALVVLNLRNNTISDLTYLPTTSKLQTLSLQTNFITNATYLSSSLRPFGDSLNYIYIQENRLTSIPDLSFLINVESLDFSNNRLSDIHSGKMPPNLFDLKLGYNSFTSVPSIMSSLKSVTDVVLMYNNIRSIHDVDLPSNTVSIELAFNLITELTDTSLPNTSSIRFLHLNNNPLVRISNLAFKNLANLMELNLRSTKLTRMPLALSSLTSLNVFDITGSIYLVCTCLEKSLEPWIRHFFPSNVIGTCGQTSVYDFYVNLSPDCPS